MRAKSGGFQLAAGNAAGNGEEDPTNRVAHAKNMLDQSLISELRSILRLGRRSLAVCKRQYLRWRLRPVCQSDGETSTMRLCHVLDPVCR